MDVDQVDSIFRLYMDKWRKACKIQAFKVLLFFGYRIWALDDSSLAAPDRQIEEDLLHTRLKTGGMKKSAKTAPPRPPQLQLAGGALGKERCTHVRPGTREL